MVEIANKIVPCPSHDVSEILTACGTEAALGKICADAATCASAWVGVAARRVLREGFIYPIRYCTPCTSKFINVRGLPNLKADAASASDAVLSQVVSLQFRVIVCFLNGRRLEISVLPTFQVLDLISLIEFYSNTSGKGYGYMHGGRRLCNEDDFTTIGITPFAQIHQFVPKRDDP